MPRNKPSRLDDTPRFQSPYGNRRQEGREQEVVSGGDDDDVVFLVVELFEEGSGTPSVSEDDDGLLLRVLVELGTGVEVLLGDYVRGWAFVSLGEANAIETNSLRTVDESTSSNDNGEQDSPCELGPQPSKSTLSRYPIKRMSLNSACDPKHYRLARLTFFLVPSLTVGAASVAGTLGSGVMGSRGGVGLVAYDRDERERRAAGDRRAEVEEVARREEIGEARMGRVRLAD